MLCLQAIEGEGTDNPLICNIMNLLCLLNDKDTRSFLLDTKPLREMEECDSSVSHTRVYETSVGVWARFISA